MKKRIIASALAVSATLASIPSEAAPVYRQARDSAPRVNVYQQAYTYASIDMMNWTYSTTTTTAADAGDGAEGGDAAAATTSSSSESGTSTRLTFGQRFEEFVSAEAQLTLGSGEHEYTVGIYGRWGLPMGRLQIKGLLGVAASQFDNAGSVTSDTSLSYGAGAELTVWRDWYLNADFMSYSSDFDAINIGIGHRF